MIRQFKGKILKWLFKSAYKPGAYYSTVPDMDFVRKNRDRIFAERAPESIRGIVFRKNEMTLLLNSHKYIFSNFSFPEHKKDAFRYYTDNIFFNKADALALLIIVENFKPKRIIEIGSGFSSALMLDIVDRSIHPLQLTFIEPYPQRLYSLLSTADKGKCVIKEDFVEKVPLDFFHVLQANDILFIDSSHVSKIGSDLNHLLFEVLPSLNAGVIIHFHDIFYPFEYPYSWVSQGISWNEAYLLRAFLMYNTDFEILLFNDFVRYDVDLKSLYSDLITGGSIYLRKR